MTDVRVLIVDDQPAFREAMRMVVEMSDGFVCVGEATDGIDAIEAAARLGPDLILMDVNMPAMDGLAATREIRRRLGEIHVFVMSTHESGGYEGPAIEAGATAFIPKSSFSMEGLAASWARATSSADEPSSD